MSKQGLSVLISTRNDINEAYELITYIYKIADEIVILDSSDREEHKRLKRIKKVLRLGKVRIYYIAAFGFADAFWEYGRRKCRYEWIYLTGTDERLSEYTRKHIKETLSKAKVNGFRIKRDENGTHITYQLNFFKRDKAKFFGWIHGSAEIDGGEARLPDEFSIIHKGEHLLKGPEMLNHWQRYLAVERYQHRVIFERVVQARVPMKRVFSWVIKKYMYITGKKMGDELSRTQYYLFYILYWIRGTIADIQDGNTTLSGIQIRIKYDCEKIETLTNKANDNLHELDIQKALYKSNGMVNFIGLNTDADIKKVNDFAKKNNVYGTELFIKLIEERYTWEK